MAIVRRYTEEFPTDMTRVECRFQSPTSMQTLAEGLAEYYSANPHLKRGDELSPDAREFFRSHDVVHVLYGAERQIRRVGSMRAEPGDDVAAGGVRLDELRCHPEDFGKLDFGERRHQQRKELRHHDRERRLQPIHVDPERVAH